MQIRKLLISELGFVSGAIIWGFEVLATMWRSSRSLGEVYSKLARCVERRSMSNLPESTVYGGPKSKSPWKRVTLRHLEAKYQTNQPITVVTAYDYPSGQAIDQRVMCDGFCSWIAPSCFGSSLGRSPLHHFLHAADLMTDSLGGLAGVHVDRAGIDICLVGDSVGMVVHGHDTTLPVTMEDMLLHCRAVARGADRPLLVGDLPFGSYEQSTQQVCKRKTQKNEKFRIFALRIFWWFL